MIEMDGFRFGSGSYPPAKIIDHKGGTKVERIRGFEVCKGFENESIKLPKRSTRNAGGYDFEAAEDITIPPAYKSQQNESGYTFPTVLIKTGVKAYMQPDEVLKLYNRSSSPKKGIVISNGVGIIDMDYYNNPTNDGHIMFSAYNIHDHAIHIKKGDRIGQGIFEKYLKADGDSTDSERSGGFGSTGN